MYYLYCGSQSPITLLPRSSWPYFSILEREPWRFYRIPALASVLASADHIPGRRLLRKSVRRLRRPRSARGVMFNSGYPDHLELVSPCPKWALYHVLPLSIESLDLPICLERDPRDWAARCGRFARGLKKVLHSTVCECPIGRVVPRYGWCQVMVGGRRWETRRPINIRSIWPIPLAGDCPQSSKILTIASSAVLMLARILSVVRLSRACSSRLNASKNLFWVGSTTILSGPPAPNCRNAAGGNAKC